MVSTLQTSLTTFLDAQRRFVQLGSDWEVLTISPWLWDSLSSSRCLFTGKDPLLQLGSQCTARSWRGPQGPVSILAQDCLVRWQQN